MVLPSDLKYTVEHAWLKIRGDKARLGITDYILEQLGDVNYIDLPEVGTMFSAGDVFTEVETSKTTLEITSPVSGEVISVNEELRDSPGNLNDDAFASWIVQIKLSDDTELDDLLTADEYEEEIG
ncbi:glycine cleavage system protein GcvH [Parasporobacterium paucivorans]|uniref:Glycine cleavage system H protein n=1 Tax=Parasporobacterium paucivorans DSM 15970 TaxID=1122934 RepID=A0A1M6IJX9_9FIRM|nr:glycine cleavage system protein GcvH [Parasporobacterium paucivorans]SHJ34782.1 glycine cleavage system H protein [Parasporobacterium paucivorans DSM 15970]